MNTTKTKSKNKMPENASHLNPAFYNPRKISDDSFAGLKMSLEKFGDISGIVYNLRTSRLVCGHQRLKTIPQDAKIKLLSESADARGTVALGVIESNKGEISIRFVEWDDATEKAANIAANNPHIQGEFTEDIEALLEEIRLDSEELYNSLNFEAIEIPAELGEPLDYNSLIGDGDQTPASPAGNTPDASAGTTTQLSDTQCTLGEYRFAIKRDDYINWRETLRLEYGFDERSIIREIKRRLGFGGTN